MTRKLFALMLSMLLALGCISCLAEAAPPSLNRGIQKPPSRYNHTWKQIPS